MAGQTSRKPAKVPKAAAKRVTAKPTLLDALVRNVPDVRKAVKWNSPFYGLEGQGWFLNFHCFTKYVEVRPAPPGESKHKEVRYLDIHEDDELDEARLSIWIRQAAALPGWGGT